jgi:hypothetical protein
VERGTPRALGWTNEMLDKAFHRPVRVDLAWDCFPSRPYHAARTIAEGTLPRDDGGQVAGNDQLVGNSHDDLSVMSMSTGSWPSRCDLHKRMMAQRALYICDPCYAPVT